MCTLVPVHIHVCRFRVLIMLECLHASNLVVDNDDSWKIVRSCHVVSASRQVCSLIIAFPRRGMDGRGKPMRLFTWKDGFPTSFLVGWRVASILRAAVVELALALGDDPLSVVAGWSVG